MNGWLTLLLSPIFVLVPLNMYGQYYLVTHVPSGYPSSRAAMISQTPLDQEAERKWLDLNTEKSIWSPERWGMRKKGRVLTAANGYSHAGGRDEKRIKRCRKCDGPKPEVRNWKLA